MSGRDMVTERQRRVLNVIVDAYIRDAAPIASEVIARNRSLGVSPATIRNDVAQLEDEGYLTRPHTSAGSIPLDKAYRVYVDSIASIATLRIPVDVRYAVRKKLVEVEREVDDWASVAAALLASLVGNLAIATFPKARESRIRHIEVVPLQEFVALLIIVLEQTRLRRQLIRLKEPVDRASLEVAANRLTDLLTGHSWREIDAETMVLSPLEEEILDTTIFMLKAEEGGTHRDHYVDGLRNLLDQPEFARNERVRAVVKGVEDGSLAQAVLEEVPEGGVVRVVIGQENRGDMLWPLSVVIGQYGIPGGAEGAIGTVGPVRMEYATAIAGVQLITGVMSELVEGVHGG